MTRTIAIWSAVLAVGIGLVTVLAMIGVGEDAAVAQTTAVSQFVAPTEIDTASLEGPRQPVFFRHDIHAGQYQIPCQYCHSTVTVSSEPGIPSMETCMGCHQFIRGSTPEHQAEIKKLVDAWTARQPIEWVRIHSVPQFAHFPHMRHIKALGPDACVICHGDVQTMAQVSQQQTLKMGWCANCHTSNNVTIDCTSCHF